MVKLGDDSAKARALKRALTQLKNVRHVVPGYLGLHTNVLATLRALTGDLRDDISAAGSEPELDSPVVADVASQRVLGTPVTARGDTLVVSSPAKGTATDAKYYVEEEEEQRLAASVAPVNALLSLIGGFSLGNHDTSGQKVMRRRKVKKEAPPMTPEEEKKMLLVEAAAANVVKKVNHELLSRWGEAPKEQLDLLGKNVRRGARHLPEPTCARAQVLRLLPLIHFLFPARAILRSYVYLPVRSMQNEIVSMHRAVDASQSSVSVVSVGAHHGSDEIVGNPKRRDTECQESPAPADVSSPPPSLHSQTPLRLSGPVPCYYHIFHPQIFPLLACSASKLVIYFFQQIRFVWKIFGVQTPATKFQLLCWYFCFRLFSPSVFLGPPKICLQIYFWVPNCAQHPNPPHPDPPRIACSLSTAWMTNR